MAALIPPHFRPTPRYHEAMRTLEELNVWNDLAAFRPTFVGTIPIGIDIPSSDIDLICEVREFASFTSLLVNLFSSYSIFNIQEMDLQGPAIHCRFATKTFEIEIVGQNKSIEENRAYRHMLVEAKLLDFVSHQQRQKIITLKLAGIKTEPAFCIALGISGDPFEILDQLADANDHELKKLVSLSKTPIADA